MGQVRWKGYTHQKGEYSILEELLKVWNEIAKKYNLERDSKCLIRLSHTPRFRPGEIHRYHIC